MLTNPPLALVAAVFLLLAGPANFAAAQEGRKVAVSASDQMKYDVTTITGNEGETLEITLTNKGSLPKVAMAHNFVILKPGTDALAFALAGASQRANGYLPLQDLDKVIVSTKLLGPGESDTISFTPKETGSYPFVCTFPGHATQMRGVITVQ